MAQRKANVAERGRGTARKTAHAVPIADLALFDLPTGDPGFAADPLPWFAAARSRW